MSERLGWREDALPEKHAHDRPNVANSTAPRHTRRKYFNLESGIALSIGSMFIPRLGGKYVLSAVLATETIPLLLCAQEKAEYPMMSRRNFNKRKLYELRLTC
jgi:hypothetical protein